MLTAGTVLAERFEIQKLFLICRFSTLFHAIDQQSGEAVVLRVLRLRPPLPGQQDQRDAERTQIEREGAAVSQFAHPNLPAVTAIHHDQDRVVLVLEPFSGRTLDVVVREEGAMSVERAGRIMVQFVDALAFLHGRTPPIIHRDLRPHSVVLTDNGVLKIAEFGLARIFEPGHDPTTTLFRAEGNANYAAPEQLGRSPSAPCNDIYSFGAIMYFLLTREHPAKSVERMMGDTRMRPLHEIAPGVPPELETIVDRMIAPARSARYETVSEIASELANAFPHWFDGP